ncbi:stage II sporulation protein D [Paenibacillus sp. GSMTC-2017]|uniref:stage II sporulation protein D n=1 Tax=Paenibacillus sp. GSMTC-2017 TaxID=2794350 RepID=UPI0018DA33A1|nr:stage II sporulation protein D [Paenibacillus sp. GSMTC-2017]MBH5320584.1 stage II sporulation protein D [Paenibacillus sp. GSMTC-2017]
MSIRVTKRLARIKVLKTVGKKRWFIIFGIGVLLGTIVFGMKVSIAAFEERSNKVYTSVVEREPKWVSAAEQKKTNVKNNPQSTLKDTENTLESNIMPIFTHPPRKQEDRSDSKVAIIPSEQLSGALDDVKVRVYLTNQKRVETVPIETYVMGVLVGEMPMDFHLEALKAQAIAARTYIVRKLSSETKQDRTRKKADVLDTVQHQVYLSEDELANRWRGEEKKVLLAKLQQAVEETKGLIVTYKGEPIEAAFFSTSNGYTENSEDYWEQSLPYLRSVDSPWDKEISPRYEQQFAFKRADIYRAMGLSGKFARAKLVMKVTERTEGKRIKEIQINGKTYSGREVRERLGLASSQFKWKIEKDKVIFTTYGLGHGVGMSQWGANGMAQDGRDAKDILLHYYTDSTVEQASKLRN